jgi:transcriptional regulator with XRE-family HTH domain
VNIAKYRKAAGMTQQELAKKMRVHQSAVSLWETQDTARKTNPVKKSWKKLARILGCTVEDLLKEE